MSEHPKTGTLRNVIAAWRDGLKAIVAMPILFAVALLATFAIDAASSLMPESVSRLPLAMQGVSLVAAILRGCLLAPLAIAVHRYVLLGEVTGRYRLDPFDPIFRRFVGFTILFSVIYALPGLTFVGFTILFSVIYALPGLWYELAFLTHGPGAIVSFVLWGALYVMVIVVTVRRVILFPAIAIEAPGAGWRNAGNDTKGRSWVVLGTLFVAALPTVAMVVPFRALHALRRVGIGLGADTADLVVNAMDTVVVDIADLVVNAMATVVALCVLAAAASHLYWAFAASSGRYEKG